VKLAFPAFVLGLRMSGALPLHASIFQLLFVSPVLPVAASMRQDVDPLIPQSSGWPFEDPARTFCAFELDSETIAVGLQGKVM
jgi:hypothetical protein